VAGAQGGDLHGEVTLVARSLPLQDQRPAVGLEPPRLARRPAGQMG
jgi:hypothetical protein